MEALTRAPEHDLHAHIGRDSNTTPSSARARKSRKSVTRSVDPGIAVHCSAPCAEPPEVVPFLGQDLDAATVDGGDEQPTIRGGLDAVREDPLAVSAPLAAHRPPSGNEAWIVGPSRGP